MRTPNAPRAIWGKRSTCWRPRPLIEQALAAATRAFGATTDEAAYAEQQRLTLERLAAERRLMELMQPDADAGR